MMSQLLVSVRSIEEARVALKSGVDILDVKEPSRGALGAASVDTIRGIARLAREPCPVSVALGELVDFQPYEPDDLSHVQLAKVGLAHCADVVDWRTRWRQAVESLPEKVSRVAVAYADQPTAHSPAWQAVLDKAVDLGCAVLLVDTFHKNRGRLLDWMPMSDLEQVVRAVRGARLRCALAGSLTKDDIARIRQVIDVDVYAVRGAACVGGRDGCVSEAAIHALQSNLQVAARVSWRERAKSPKSRG